jgi:hypothetical protein
MGQTGHHAHHHRQLDGLGERKRHGHGIVAFLLVGGFHDGYHGKLSIEAGVLLVLRRVHGRVVGSQHHETAVDACDGGVDEGVGTHVHAHMLHADECALAGVRHAEGSLHGCLLVGAPAAVDAALAAERMALYELGDFCRRRARIGIDARQPCMERTQGNGFVAKQ